MKKSILFIVSFLVLSTFIQAQTSKLKHYKTLLDNCEGESVALYVDTSVEGSEQEIEKLNYGLTASYTEVRKVSDSNYWLFKRAMGEWSYKAGETYYAVVASSLDADECLIFYVTITEDTEHPFFWRCWLLDEEDFDDAQSLADELKEFAAMKEIPEEPVTEVQISDEYKAQREILDWFTSLGAMRIVTNEEKPASVVVDIALGYKKDDFSTCNEILTKNVEIKDKLVCFLKDKCVQDFNSDNEQKLKIEIRNFINDEILETSKIKDISFLQLDVLEQ